VIANCAQPRANQGQTAELSRVLRIGNYSVALICSLAQEAEGAGDIILPLLK
jgi:hypothetical protein